MFVNHRSFGCVGRYKWSFMCDWWELWASPLGCLHWPQKQLEFTLSLICAWEARWQSIAFYWRQSDQEGEKKQWLICHKTRKMVTKHWTAYDWQLSNAIDTAVSATAFKLFKLSTIWSILVSLPIDSTLLYQRSQRLSVQVGGQEPSSAPFNSCQDSSSERWQAFRERLEVHFQDQSCI